MIEILDHRKLNGGKQGSLAVNIVLVIASALLSALAFPKFNLHYLAWFSLTPLFLAIYFASSKRQAAIFGLLWGLVFFLTNLFWVSYLANFVGFWGYFGYFCLALYEAVFILVFCLFAKVIIEKPFALLSVPLLWTCFEWLRGVGPFGVSAGVIGYTQSHQLLVIQIASFSTVYGVSLVLAFVGMAITEFIVSCHTKKLLFASGKMVLTGAVVLLVFLYGQAQLQQRPLSPLAGKTIAIVQPNIEQRAKLDTNKVYSTFRTHEKLTRSVLPVRPDIVIWPESCVFSYLVQNQLLLKRMRDLVRDSGSYFIVGTPYHESRDRIYNSMVFFSPSAEVTARYDKQQLVPFGEYLPFRPLLYPLLQGTGFFASEFSQGERARELPSIAGVNIGPAICFESTLPFLMKERARQGADILLTLTNDAWFFDSSAPFEHIDNGIFRAVENRKYFIQCANTGISAVIDPYGRVLTSSEMGKEQVVVFGF
ncbi:MAG: apolipoprotein N-acyltransferase [Candidatus Margulisiibacteriota bacterium]